eukprot:SAG11_NODE_477_length_9118_cov_3.513582_10_plen_225_part_00
MAAQPAGRCDPTPEPNAPLPLGWEAKESTQQPGRVYYYNSATDETRWDRPSDSALGAVATVRLEIGYDPAYGPYDPRVLCGELLAVGSDRPTAVGLAGMIAKAGKAMIKLPRAQAATLVAALAQIPSLSVAGSPPTEPNDRPTTKTVGSRRHAAVPSALAEPPDTPEPELAAPPMTAAAAVAGPQHTVGAAGRRKPARGCRAGHGMAKYGCCAGRPKKGDLEDA